MKVFDKRPKDMGKLIVVGGPGGSGASTIAKMIAREYGLHYVYGGQMMRAIAQEKGYVKDSELDDFLESLKGSSDRFKYDREVDEKILKMSYKPNVLIDSKVFAGLATIKRIPCTVKIWLAADLEARVRRTLHKTKQVDLDVRLPKDHPLYRETMSDLVKRHSDDMNRYKKLYGIDYNNPKRYNDIVLDSSKLDAHRTFSLVVKRIESGEYFE